MGDLRSPLTEDTWVDKLIRFLIGAVLGGIAAASFILFHAQEHAGVLRTIGIVSGGAGILAVLVGNQFIERFLRDQWWR